MHERIDPKRARLPSPSTTLYAAMIEGAQDAAGDYMDSIGVKKNAALPEGGLLEGWWETVARAMYIEIARAGGARCEFAVDEDPS